MGRPQFQQVVQSSPMLKTANLEQSGTVDVAAGTSEQITIYSPAGTVARVIGCYLNVTPTPTGATAGYDDFDIALNSVGIILGSRTYNSAGGALSFNNGHWVGANNTTQPAGNDSPEAYWLGQTVFDATSGIQCSYSNETTAGVQSGTRTYALAVVETAVPSF